MAEPSKPSAPGDLTRREFLEVAAVSVVIAGAVVAGTAVAAVPARTTVAGYILTRLHEHGVDTLFGVPGATCDPMFAAAQGSGVAVVVNSSDLEAGYAADGYARMRGLAAVTVTYGVGTLSLISVIAGAFAERCPVVVINGGPSAEDLRIQKDLGSLFSHSIGRGQTDLALFREVTAYAERAERAEDVAEIVDAAIRTAVSAQRPVYVEMAKDIWTASCPAPTGTLDTTVAPSGEEDQLAVEIVERLRAAARPVLLLGIEVQRYGLEDEVTALVEALALPWTTTFLAKSVIAERTAGFIGVYSGQRAVPSVRETVEESDAVLAIGCILGRQYRPLVTGSTDAMIRVADHEVRIGRQPPRKAALGALVSALRRQPWQPDPARLARTQLPGLSFAQRRASIPPVPSAPASSAERGLTYDQILEQVSGFLDEDFVVVTDTSLAMFPAADLNVPDRKAFVCNAVWQSIGYSVGAAVGVGIAQARRPLVICGDGGFQMTAQSLSTMARHDLRAIVVVLDNGHYGIEQWLLEPSYFSGASAKVRPYLALNRWDYTEMARALGCEVVVTVDTVAALGEALATARGSSGPTVISAVVRPHDLPSGLRAST